MDKWDLKLLSCHPLTSSGVQHNSVIIRAISTLFFTPISTLPMAQCITYTRLQWAESERLVNIGTFTTQQSKYSGFSIYSYRKTTFLRGKTLLKTGFQSSPHQEQQPSRLQPSRIGLIAGGKNNMPARAKNPIHRLLWCIVAVTHMQTTIGPAHVAVVFLFVWIKIFSIVLNSNVACLKIKSLVQ